MHLRLKFKNTLAFLLCLLYCGCNHNSQKVQLCTHSSSCIPVVVIHQAYHTLIRIPISHSPTSVTSYFSDSAAAYKWIDIGWGEEDFFQNQSFSTSLALKALFLFNKSVQRYSISNQSIGEQYGAGINFQTIHCSPKQLERLYRSITSEIDLTNAKPIHSSPTIVFVPTNRIYHGLNNCNYWTLYHLQNAGLAVNAGNTIFAEQVMFTLSSATCTNE